MSTSGTYVAAKLQESVVLDNLHLEKTGCELTDFRKIGGGYLHDWYLVHFGSCFDDDESLQNIKRLSFLNAVYYLEFEEHVMASTATKFEKGKTIWSVKKDSSSWQNSGLDFDGEPPESVKEMERKNLAEGNNLFEVPVDLFVSIVGYHYMDDDCTFEELQSTQ